MINIIKQLFIKPLKCHQGHPDTYYVNQIELEDFIINGSLGQTLVGLLRCNDCKEVYEIPFQHVTIVE